MNLRKQMKSIFLLLIGLAGTINASAESYLFIGKNDDVEMSDQFDNPEYADKKNELLADLLKWNIRLTDPLPAPVKFELQNIHPQNYLWENK
jgi:hypothetical protein